jgi:hypothetical protein
MTNKELIVKLQETVNEYGKLPVYVSDDCSGDNVSDILCDGKTVVIYDF